MKKVGERHHLSAFHVYDCGLFEGREFMVVSYLPGDRCSSITKVVFRTGETREFFLDNDGQNPKVLFTGLGEQVVTYKWPDGATTAHG